MRIGQGLRIAVTAMLFAALAAPSMAAEFTVMIATWRGCEEACEGVQEQLAKSDLDIEVIVRDAGRSRARVREILAEARAAHVDLIVSWGTSVSVGMAGTLEERGKPEFNQDIPQVFMIVADPVSAHLVESLDRTGRRHITGTYNRVPEAVNIDTLRAYLPGFRRLGLLYNRNEANSVLKRDELAELASSLGYELTAVELPLGADGRPDPASIPHGMRELKQAGVEAVYVGSSSFLQANGKALSQAALQNRLPLLSPYEELVRESGALISVATRYRDIGRLAARQAIRILSGGLPPDGLPVARLEEFAVVINLDTARRLGAFPPVDLLQIAETVN
jgi:putative ABC transport system substrate-binding protein